MENARKYRDIKLITTEARRSYLSYLDLQILMDKTFSLGLSILEISKIVIYEIWWEYLKPKYDQKKCLMNIDSFNVCIKTVDFYAIQIRVDVANYELERPLPKEKKLKSYYIYER